MAVYERAYRGYAGPLTSERWRFLVIPRMVFADVFASKLFNGFFALCFVPTAVFAVLIYLHHNVSALAALNIPAESVIAINNQFFFLFISLQSGLASLLALIVGPALISRDTANNALPLYLSRPFSRADYVLGKFSVLAILLSAITWVPGLLLYLLESSLEGPGWMLSNLRVAGAILVSSWCWIALLSLLNLAASAWVKRKSFARLLVIAVFFLGGGVGAAVNRMLETSTPWGSVLDLGTVMSRICESLFDATDSSDLPLVGAWMALVVACAFCLLLLARKVRAYEVVR